MERKPLALVADDDIALRVLAREALEQARFCVGDAATGCETPQIVLLDYRDSPRAQAAYSCKRRLHLSTTGNPARQPLRYHSRLFL